MSMDSNTVEKIILYQNFRLLDCMKPKGEGVLWVLSRDTIVVRYIENLFIHFLVYMQN